ncbi:MAG: SDR family NAD(P)-dependent oxidoreductase [Hyphomicrobiaceae bacterium]
MHHTILITGASSGIGLASARMLSERGWRVLATARREEDLARLERDVGVEAIPLELSDSGSIDRAAALALERTDGQLGALFNNAAYGQIGAVEDVTASELRRQFEVNVVGTHALTRAILPSMRAKGAGRIVQCSSVLGLVSGPYRGAYAASKFALEALSDSMRLELRGSGVDVVLIEPGPIRTRFLESALANFQDTVDIEGSVHVDTYRRRLASMKAGGKQLFKLEPEAVARKLLTALEARTPKARYYVTAPTYLAAAMKRILPARLLDEIAARQ